MIDREAIHAALFARLRAVPGFTSASRRLKHWNDVPHEEQPALFQAHRDEDARHETGKPTIWRLPFDVYVYTWTPEPEVPAATMNPLLDAVCAALAPNVAQGQRNTLGGLVHDCRINGRIETDEGTLGSQSVCIIPVEILVAD